MKTLFSLAIALALTLSVGPAIAGDVSGVAQAPATFHALSKLSPAEQAPLTPLSDDQLASIEGGQVIVVVDLPPGGILIVDGIVIVDGVTVVIVF